MTKIRKGGQNFQVVFFSREKGTKLLFSPKEKRLSCLKKQFFMKRMELSYFFPLKKRGLCCLGEKGNKWLLRGNCSPRQLNPFTL